MLWGIHSSNKFYSPWKEYNTLWSYRLECSILGLPTDKICLLIMNTCILIVSCARIMEEKDDFKHLLLSNLLLRQ